MRLIRKNGTIDLQAPIYMTDVQLERFKAFFRETFHEEVEIVPRIEPDREWNPNKEEVTRTKFSPEELFIMLRPGPVQAKVNELQAIHPERNAWTIEIKIGDTFPKFNKYLKDHDITHVTQEVVNDFLRERRLL